MVRQDWLEAYLEGWRTGDPVKSLGATASGFYYDDPDTGRVARSGFVAFFEAFMAAGAKMAGGQLPVPFLTYDDLTIVGRPDGGGPGIAWCWWQVTGTDFRGTACIRFDGSGVLNERIAYFTDAPNETPLPDGG